MWQSFNSDSVHNAAICCMNHPMSGLWFDFSWSLTKNMQATQRFASKVLKSSKVGFCPLTKESIVLDLDYSKC